MAMAQSQCGIGLAIGSGVPRVCSFLVLVLLLPLLLLLLLLLRRRSITTGPPFPIPKFQFAILLWPTLANNFHHCP
jgi:hypothetical protein